MFPSTYFPERYFPPRLFPEGDPGRPVATDSDLPWLISPQENEAIFQATGGVVVTYGSKTTYGHYSDETEGILPGPMGFDVRAGGISVLVATGILEDMDDDTSITVNGWSFKIRTIDRENEGMDTRIWLKEVDA